MIIRVLIICFLSILIHGTSMEARNKSAVLYQADFCQGQLPQDVLLEGDLRDFSLKSDGLEITGTKGRMRLDRFYSLGKRCVKYVVKFSPDAVAEFYSDNRDIVFRVDVAGRQIMQMVDTQITATADILEADTEFLIEMEHDYAVNTFRITNLRTGKQASLSQECDGPGGYGRGAIQPKVFTGCMWDYYCLSLVYGTSISVRQMSVTSPAKVRVLMYGDSITQPECYYPKVDFASSWTQLILSRLKGKGMTSGRNGTTIREVLLRIRNELPYIRAKYVMVTIGTNGGNTEENLSELIEYIRFQGAEPILNNIPCNEENDQVGKNELIAHIREKYNIRGCRFDRATSLQADGKELDRTLMYYENYIDVYGKDFYHHPNPEGSMRMYQQTLIDIPEIYH